MSTTLSYRLRLGNKPLRFVLAEYFTPLNALYLYLAVLAFYALFLFLPVSLFGQGFLGIYGRPMTLGLYLFASLTLAFAVVNERRKQRRLQSSSGGLLGLGVFFLLAALIVVLGIGRGWIGLLPYIGQYQQGLVIMLLVAPLAYYAIPSQTAADRMLRRVALFLAGLAIAQLVVVVSRFIPGMALPGDTRDFLFILPVAVIYFFVQYMTKADGAWRTLGRAGLFGAVFLGCIVTFQKPVVVPLVVALALVWLFLLLFGLRTHRFSAAQLIWRLLFIFVAGVAAVLVADAVIPGGFLTTYRNAFYYRYLKANPATGQVEGRIDGGRLEYYGLAWRYLEGRRFLGLGFGSGIPHPYLAARYAFPHSLILDFLLGFGIAGLIALLSGLSVIALHIALNMRWQEHTTMKVTLVGFLLYALLYSLVSFFWGHVAMVHAVAILLGVSLKVATLDRQQGKWT